MKKTIEHFYCDIYKEEAETTSINYPVVFHTDQTEGRPSDAYISHMRLDACKKCLDKILMLDGTGAQGNNYYTIREVSKQ